MSNWSTCEHCVARALAEFRRLHGRTPTISELANFDAKFLKCPMHAEEAPDE